MKFTAVAYFKNWSVYISVTLVVVSILISFPRVAQREIAFGKANAELEALQKEIMNTQQKTREVESQIIRLQGRIREKINHK